MAIHEYQCPTCKSYQRVKAQAGERVEVKDCAACENAKLDEALDAHADEAEEGTRKARRR